VLFDMVNQSAQLYDAKPTVVENDFDEVHTTEDGLAIKNARYKTRVRSSEEVCMSAFSGTSQRSTAADARRYPNRQGSSGRPTWACKGSDH
jgi:hypothetical protein